MKAKNTSIHGYNRKTTPFFEQFAREATVYTQARAPGMTSLPSHTSMFTGLEVEEHRIHDLVSHSLDPESTIWHTLAEDYDYETGVFSDNVNLTGDGSLKTAFNQVVGRRGRLFPDATDPDIFFNSPEYLQSDSDRSKHIEYLLHCIDDSTPIKSLANGAAKQLSRTFASATLEQKLDHSADRFLKPFYSWIDAAEGSWAACINLMDTHLPFYPSNEYDIWGGKKKQRTQAAIDPTSWKVYGGEISWNEWIGLEDLYDGTIRQADAYLQSLIQELKERNIFEDTLVVITSDHGEGFGEYSRVKPDFRIAGHIVGLHESLLHVPLLVSYPGQSNSQRVTELATLRRFPDTVKAVLKDNWSGDEFVPESSVVASASTVDNKLKSQQRAGRYCDDISKYGGTIRAVYRRKDGIIRKYLVWDDDGVTIEIEDAQTAATVKQEDPHENVRKAFSGYTDAGVAKRQGDIDEGTLTHLESLGYV
ncbi:arylsulfatase [Halalkaliarchaeum desulfuricum]|uniref:Arylsulfatase n=1 Tax=Halalkaliarchaeum desulfuricum TaxID=2055893 RepID=A0A343TN57_9EURY|nr:arylsulfatase [Halalkaliarchaeum desulfuricum]